MSSAGQSAKKLGILVGGGPAPGINSVIGSATIKAVVSVQLFASVTVTV